MRIAIIGSGIAGLCAAWSLSGMHDVTLYEAHERLGMDAHSLDVPDGRGGTLRVDVPLRVFHEGYYPTLTRIYREAGIPFTEIDSAASFTTSDGRLVFRYGNVSFGRHRVPWITRAGLTDPRVVALAAEIGLFVLRLKRERRRADVRRGITFNEYLASSRWSRRLVERFLVPAVAGICTCTYETARGFPAQVVLDYLDSPRTNSMLRATRGARDVTERLTRRAGDICLSSPVARLEAQGDSIQVSTAHDTRTFDHVVFATQAHLAARLAPVPDNERNVIAGFAYEKSRLVVHTDASLAPPRRSWWSPVNYMLDPNAAAPMTTVLLSGLHPTAWTGPEVFQTWNPYRDPAAGTALQDVTIDRAVVGAGNAARVSALRELHRQPGRRVWYCGSYASEGMTLQEAAAVSAVSVATTLSSRVAP